MQLNRVPLALSIGAALTIAQPAKAVVDAYIGVFDTEYIRIYTADAGRCLDEPSAGPGLQLATNAPLYDLSSHWYLEASTVVGEYWIRNRLTDNAMHRIEGTGSVESGLLDPQDAAYRWVFEGGRNYFHIRNASGNERYLTSDGGSQNGLTTESPDGGEGQRFILEDLPQGALMPWQSYDESNYTGLIAPAHIDRTTYDGGFDQGTPASEAQNLGVIVVNGFGTEVNWTIEEAANAITIRYSVLDGSNGTLTLAIRPQSGGPERTYKVPIPSNQAWVYFENGTEFNANANGRIPGKRFAEARLLLDTPIEAGDTLALSRQTGDELFWIDVVELEMTAPSMPEDMGNFFDATASPWNTPNDGSAEAYFKILQCLNDAAAAGKGVYLPEGTYTIGFELTLPPGAHLHGAGMWHTELHFTNSGYQGAGGIRGTGDNTSLSDLFIKGSQVTRYAGYKGIKGHWGSGSVIENVWVTETETGMWISDFAPPFGVTDGLVVRNSRFRQTFADGINLAGGTRNSIVENCHFRGNGDDALASWASRRQVGIAATFNQKFRYNTMECGFRAAGIGIFGGGGHEIHHNVIRDQYIGSGIRLNSVFLWVDGVLKGHGFNNSGEPIRIYKNTLINTGARNLFGEEVGAIELTTRDANVENIIFSDIEVQQSQFNGIRLQGNNTSASPSPQFTNVSFDAIRINNVPTAVRGSNIAEGLAHLNDLSIGDGVTTRSSSVRNMQIMESTTLEDWLITHFENADAPEADLQEDPNQNGLPNLLEFAFGLDPNANAPLTHKNPQVAVVWENGQPYMEMTYRLRGAADLGSIVEGLLIDGVRITPQRSMNPGGGSWSNGSDHFAPSGSRLFHSDGAVSHTVRLNGPINPADFAFIQVTVEAGPDN
jgi:hypothetical protein